MKRLVLKPSNLDLRAPEGVQVMFRLQHPMPKRPPIIIADYDTIEAAQEHSDRLTRGNQYHEYMTWWRKDKRHVHKWSTLLGGHNRHYRVSVPYVSGMTDDMVKEFLQQAIITSPDKPLAYTSETVRVRVDNTGNREEIDHGTQSSAPS